jgi:tetratricopeptide (TPR) repeat protein
VSEDKKTIVKMAHIYSQEGRWDKAIAEYKKLIKLDPEDFNSFSMLGDVLVKKGELQPAFDAYFVCSDAYIRLGQLEKAALVQSKIARLNPEALNADSKAKQSVFQKQVEGDKAMDGGDLDAAIASYQNVLGMDPDRFDLYQKLGDLFLRKGDIEQACRKYLEIGDIYFRNKLIKKAAPIYLKVVELDPENVDAHAALADIQAKSGNESEAKKELLLLAEFLFQRGDLDRCYQFAQKGEQLKSIESYNYLGHVELRRGKRGEARAWFEKLLKFKLNHGGALWGLGLVQVEEGKPDDAMKTWARVPNTDRFYGETLEAMGSVLAGKGKSAEAAKHYQDAAAALRAKGMADAAKAATAKASELLGGAVLEDEPAAPAPAPQLPAAAAPQPPPAPAEVPAPVAQAPAPPAAALPPLPTVSTPVSAPLPPLPELPGAAEPSAEDDVETLLALADNFEAEGAFDEAIDVYQRVLAQSANDARAKEGLSRAYRMLAGGPAQAAPAEAPKAGQDDELAQLAARKAEAEAERRQAEEAARKLAEERGRAEDEARRASEARAQAEAAARKLESERSTAEALAKAEAETKLRAETETRLRAEIEARQKAEADAKRQAADAAAQAESMHKRIEAEIRAQLEEEMRRKVEAEAQARTDAEVAKKVEAARQSAEADARVKAEAEIRRQFEAERKKLENEQSGEKQRKEDELRRDISAKVEVQQRAETDRKVEAVRVHAQDEAKKRQANEVLARVEAQQKEKFAPLQRTIDEIRRKVEERAAQNNAAGSPGAPSAPAAPAAAQPLANKAAAEEPDEMDDFMTAAVADIYVKQGLVDEARRIYDRILRREPGNQEVRDKLAGLDGKPAAAAEPDAKAADPVKKSKVSYL